MKGNSGIPNFTETNQSCITNFSYSWSNMNGRGIIKDKTRVATKVGDSAQ